MSHISHFEKLFNDDVAANCTVIFTLLNLINNTILYTVGVQFIDIHTSYQVIVYLLL